MAGCSLARFWKGPTEASFVGRSRVRFPLRLGLYPGRKFEILKPRRGLKALFDVKGGRAEAEYRSNDGLSGALAPLTLKDHQASAANGNAGIEWDFISHTPNDAKALAPQIQPGLAGRMGR